MIDWRHYIGCILIKHVRNKGHGKECELMEKADVFRASAGRN
jgi:hypothetical protein